MPSPLYADLSGYYDLMCDGIDYAAQCAQALRVLSVFGESGGRACLDLACGTGRHLALLHQAGMACSGLDYSAAMLAQAAQRCPEARLLCADFSGLQADAEYDLITCFLYSLHYSHPVSALRDTLARLYRALRPGGVLLFDCVDMRGIDGRDAVSEARCAEGELRFRSGWRYGGSGETLTLAVQIELQSARQPLQQWQEAHAMTALTFPQLALWLAAVGFEVEWLERDFEVLLPLRADRYNALCVARRPSTDIHSK